MIEQNGKSTSKSILFLIIKDFKTLHRSSFLRTPSLFVSYTPKSWGWNENLDVFEPERGMLFWHLWPWPTCPELLLKMVTSLEAFPLAEITWWNLSSVTAMRNSMREIESSYPLSCWKGLPASATPHLTSQIGERRLLRNPSFWAAFTEYPEKIKFDPPLLASGR